jgi:hypothetical protein
MSTKIENVVYRASWRDEISANFLTVSFFRQPSHVACFFNTRGQALGTIRSR